MRKFRMPSHGTAVAYAALFVSLGGSAVAIERASVTSREIATGAVRSSEIATGAVKRSEIKTGAVGSAEVRTDAVRAREIRAGAVAASELARDAVEQPAIADDAVGARQIQVGAVGADALAVGAVRSAGLFDGAVTAPKLAADAVDGANVADGSLELGDVAEVVADVTYDPPLMSPGDCQADESIAVPNKQVGDLALVLPGSGEGSSGWNSEFTLRGYASNGSGAGNTISVVVCRPFGSGPVDAGPQPLRVLLFR